MTRRRRFVRATIPPLALAIVIASCGSRDPSSYNRAVGREFVSGCQVILAGSPDNANDSAVNKAISGDPDARRHRATCQCVYSAVSDKQTGIPFKDFKALQDAVRRGSSLASIASAAPSTQPDLARYARQLRDDFETCARTPPRPSEGGSDGSSP